jgi:hypothetical protein
METLLTRREMLELALCAAAAPGGERFFAEWLKPKMMTMSQAPPQPDLLRDYQPHFFSPEDFQALQAFTEILIPTDETPGAREARCAHFIDFVLNASGEGSAVQSSWRKAMAAVKDTGFHTAEPLRRVELVTEMARPETDHESRHPASFAYRLIKQQNTFAFYTSRAGMIETLDYKGNSYNLVFPACNHPEHHTV